MRTPADNLARLRDSDRRDTKPFRSKLETGRSVQIPGYTCLARIFALPLLGAEAEVFRSGSAILTRPLGSSEAPTAVPIGTVARQLREAVQALPELASSEARRPYIDLRHFVREAEPATVAGYFRKAAEATRSAAPKWCPPKPPKTDRPPAKSHAEHRAAFEARARRAEAESAHWALAAILEDLDPGAKIAGTELCASAKELLAQPIAEREEARENGESWEEHAEYCGFPLDPRFPRLRVFYAAADALLGARKRNKHGYYYTVPTPKGPTA